jgi:hypothetical protein
LSHATVRTANPICGWRRSAHTLAKSQHRSWIFPRDPNFVAKNGPSSIYPIAFGRVLQGANEFFSADEKTNIQAQRPKTTDFASRPQPPTRVEHKYFRGSALARWTSQAARQTLAFQFHYERTAFPFKWTFTRCDLHALLAKLDPSGSAGRCETDSAGVVTAACGRKQAM